MDCTRTITQCMPLDMVFQIEVGGGGFPLSGRGGGQEILLGCQFRWWCEPKKN